MQRSPAIAIASTLLQSLSAHASELLDHRSGAERLRDTRFHVQPEDRASAERPLASDLRQGDWWITAIGGSSISLGSTTDSFAGVQATKFVIDRLEAGGEVAGWGFFQDSEDAYGVSLSAVVRYHAWDFGGGTLFADAGLGMVFTNDVTPQQGTSANFLPRLGAGLALRTGDNSRFLFGARWHHVSNARVFGELNNPSRDEVMLFAGFQWKL